MNRSFILILWIKTTNLLKRSRKSDLLYYLFLMFTCLYTLQEMFIRPESSPHSWSVLTRALWCALCCRSYFCNTGAAILTTHLLLFMTLNMQYSYSEFLCLRQIHTILTDTSSGLAGSVCYPYRCWLVLVFSIWTCLVAIFWVVEVMYCYLLFVPAGWCLSV